MCCATVGRECDENVWGALTRDPPAPLTALRMGCIGLGDLRRVRRGEAASPPPSSSINVAAAKTDNRNVIENIRQRLAAYNPRPVEGAFRARAAILVPLYFREGALHVVLTKRT